MHVMHIWDLISGIHTCHPSGGKCLQVAASVPEHPLERVEGKEVKGLARGAAHDVDGVSAEQRPPAAALLHDDGSALRER